MDIYQFYEIAEPIVNRTKDIDTKSLLLQTRLETLLKKLLYEFYTWAINQPLPEDFYEIIRLEILQEIEWKLEDKDWLDSLTIWLDYTTSNVSIYAETHYPDSLQNNFDFPQPFSSPNYSTFIELTNCTKIGLTIYPKATDNFIYATFDFNYDGPETELKNHILVHTLDNICRRCCDSDKDYEYMHDCIHKNFNMDYTNNTVHLHMNIGEWFLDNP